MDPLPGQSTSQHARLNDNDNDDNDDNGNDDINDFDDNHNDKLKSRKGYLKQGWQIMYKYKLHILPRSAAPIADQLILDHLSKLTITYRYINKDRKKVGSYTSAINVNSTSNLNINAITPLRHKHQWHQWHK